MNFDATDSNHMNKHHNRNLNCEKCTYDTVPPEVRHYPNTLLLLKQKLTLSSSLVPSIIAFMIASEVLTSRLRTTSSRLARSWMVAGLEPIDTCRWSSCSRASTNPLQGRSRAAEKCVRQPLMTLRQ